MTLFLRPSNEAVFIRLVVDGAIDISTAIEIDGIPRPALSAHFKPSYSGFIKKKVLADAVCARRTLVPAALHISILW